MFYFLLIFLNVDDFNLIFFDVVFIIRKVWDWLVLFGIESFFLCIFLFIIMVLIFLFKNLVKWVLYFDRNFLIFVEVILFLFKFKKIFFLIN